MGRRRRLGRRRSILRRGGQREEPLRDRRRPRQGVVTHHRPPSRLQRPVRPTGESGQGVLQRGADVWPRGVQRPHATEEQPQIGLLPLAGQRPVGPQQRVRRRIRRCQRLPRDARVDVLGRHVGSVDPKQRGRRPIQLPRDLEIPVRGLRLRRQGRVRDNRRLQHLQLGVGQGHCHGLI